MRIYGFTNESFVDGPGIRVVVFAQGCDNACPRCHNPDSWDMHGGEEHSVKEIIKKIKKASGRTRETILILEGNGKKKAPAKKVTGVTFSGGEPFLQADELAQVAQAVKKLGLDITTYTGNTYEVLKIREDNGIQTLLDLTDYLIDGLYIHEKRDINLKFRGSSNQRIIDMNKTRETGSIVLYEE